MDRRHPACPRTERQRFFMQILGVIVAVGLILLVLVDAFETVILPRRVTRKFRLTRAFYRISWRIWVQLASLATRKRRETLFSFFGPLSLLLLLAIWAFGLILAFGMLHYSLRLPLNDPGARSIGTYFYFSGTTFFTLGLGDLAPVSRTGKLLVVMESGMGFGFLALVLGYLPVLYQAFSRRESLISLLDARAGSPPTAGELLRREGSENDFEALRQLLYEWERSSAEIMESHLSYPVLAYFRSQHDNQNWLAALTAILDACALAMLTCGGRCQQQCRLTFAMARHAVVDLAQVFGAPPKQDSIRLTDAEFAWLQDVLPRFSDTPIASEQLREDLLRLRKLYEPYAIALADHLRLALPAWAPISKRSDNWQTSAWERTSIRTLPIDDAPEDDHL